MGGTDAKGGESPAAAGGSSARAVEGALARAESLEDARARQAARDLARGILAFHRDALTRLLELVGHASPAGRAALTRAAGDELVASLLSLHELAPAPIAESPPSSFIPAERLRSRGGARDAPRCEFCAEPIAEHHEHVLELVARDSACACRACALLFDAKVDGRYRRIAPRAIRLPDAQLEGAAWRGLEIPVNLVYFVRASGSGTIIASYPGPVGQVEAEIPEATWQRLAEAEPRLGDLAPDVEALLVRRLGDTPAAYLVSIDWCFRLRGMIRSRWRGLTGGDEVRAEMSRFFAALDEVAR